MPKQKYVGKVNEVDNANYTKGKIEEARSLLKQQLEEANSIHNKCFKNICMFSLIDCLAQEHADYPTSGSRKTFCDFIIKFQDRYPYLEKVEPVTLFYDYEDNIREIEEHSELKDRAPELCSRKLEVSLDDLRMEDETKVEQILNTMKAEELLKLIERDKGPEIAKKYERNHTLINLLYKMRSKAVHELSRLGRDDKWEAQYDEPIYRNVKRLYTKDGKIVSDDVVELVFPSKFIYNLVFNVIDKYLNECERQQRLPFENNSNFKRRVTITWNDK